MQLSLEEIGNCQDQSQHVSLANHSSHDNYNDRATANHRQPSV